jgi:hypothetical protein
MGHNDYVRRDGQWVGNPVPVPRDLQLLDVAQYKSLNGDSGGTWNPAQAITIGGAGFNLTGSAAHILSGGVRTDSGGRLELGHDDWPTFASSRSRNVVIPLLNIHTDIADSYPIDASLDPVGTKITATTSNVYQWTLPQRYLHNGATIAGVDLTFRVGVPHTGIPTLPTFTLARFNQGHSVYGVIATGTLPAPASATAYYANGNAQTFSGSVTGNAVVDVGLYTYIFSFFDERSTNALPGNIYSSMTLHFDTIADMRFE